MDLIAEEISKRKKNKGIIWHFIKPLAFSGISEYGLISSHLMALDPNSTTVISRSY